MRPKQEYLEKNIGTLFNSVQEFADSVVKFLNSSLEMNNSTKDQILNLRTIADKFSDMEKKGEIILPADGEIKKLIQYRVQFFKKTLNQSDDEVYIYSDVRRLSEEDKFDLKCELDFIQELFELEDSASISPRGFSNLNNNKQVSRDN